MNKAQKKRVQELSANLHTAPIPRETEEAAFERFCTTGELPEYLRAAKLVVLRVRRGGKPLEPLMNRPIDYRQKMVAFLTEVRRGALQRRRTPGVSRTVPVREYLFTEAMESTGIVRVAARAAFKAEVAAGGVVTDLEFLRGRGVPCFGSLGLHLLGFPDRLARAPFAQQAKRLFARYGVLRDRIDRGDPESFPSIKEAILSFRRTGALPQEAVLRDVVLANAELEALWDHARGRDVSARMAAFDAVLQASPEQQAEAVARVQAVAHAEPAPDGGSASIPPATTDDDVRAIASTLGGAACRDESRGSEQATGPHQLHVETLTTLFTTWDRRDPPTCDALRAEFRNLTVEERVQRLYELYDTLLVQADRKAARSPRPSHARKKAPAGRRSNARAKTRAATGKRGRGADRRQRA